MNTVQKYSLTKQTAHEGVSAAMSCLQLQPY